VEISTLDTCVVDGNDDDTVYRKYYILYPGNLYNTVILIM
jgi:hypothetical protein